MTTTAEKSANNKKTKNMKKNNTDHGFDIRQRMNEIKHDFDAAGYWGWVSFIKASILSGIVYHSDIVEEAIAISGDHLEREFSFLIEEGENEHWYKRSDGRLVVLGH